MKLIVIIGRKNEYEYSGMRLLMYVWDSIFTSMYALGIDYHETGYNIHRKIIITILSKTPLQILK